MGLMHYKPLFVVSASYELTGIGVSTNGISVNGVRISNTKMTDLKLKPIYKENVATVFYAGIDMPLAAPVTCDPVLEIGTDEYFYFSIGFSEKEKIAGLKFHTSPAIANAIGFPLLYDASINVLGDPATLTAREDVKVCLGIFTFTAAVADTGINAGFASIEVRNEQNALVDLGIQPVMANDKSIDGINAIPEFSFSVDASKLETGIYEFKVGNFKKKYFLANQIDLSDMVSLIRVLKNNFLEYKKNISDKTFALFELQIPAA